MAISKISKVQALTRCSSKPRRGQIDTETTVKLSSFWSSVAPNWSNGRKQPRIVLNEEQRQQLEEACPWLQRAVEDVFTKWVTPEEKLKALLDQGDKPKGRIVVTLPCGTRFAFRLRPYLADIAPNWGGGGGQEAKHQLSHQQKQQVEDTCPWAMPIIEELVAYKPTKEEKIQAFVDHCFQGPPAYNLVVQAGAFAFKAGVFWACIKGNWGHGKPRTLLTADEMHMVATGCPWVQVAA